MIAGPCSVESEKQIVEIAKSVKESGANMLRGGAFKPRTSPYDFPGLKAQGIELLKTAREETGLPIVTEIMSLTDLPLFEDVDVLQVGARDHADALLDRLAGPGRVDDHDPEGHNGQCAQEGAEHIDHAALAVLNCAQMNDQRDDRAGHEKDRNNRMNLSVAVRQLDRESAQPEQ